MNSFVPRTLGATLKEAATQYPVVTVTGPRQSGKTTLCRHTFPGHDYVSLEPLDNRAFAAEDPRGFLAQFPGRVILDEAQRVPALFSYIQELVDADDRAGRFIISGSENLALSDAVNQSLAGRTAMLVLLPFSLAERAASPVKNDDLDTVMLEGGYPRPAVHDIPPARWLQDYLTTYVQRDVRQLTQISDLASFTRFIRLCAGRTAQEVNLSALGSDAGVSHNTARSWLGVLGASYLIFQLPAWHSNVRKQVVKRSKLHFTDTGLVCSLLGITTAEQLAVHPLRGPIFESFVVSEVYKWRLHRGLRPELHHYRENRGIELDLLARQANSGIAVEVKAGQTVHSEFLKNLQAELFDSWTRRLIYAGERQQVRSGVELVPWHALVDTAWGDS